MQTQKDAQQITVVVKLRDPQDVQEQVPLMVDSVDLVLLHLVPNLI